MAPKPSEIVREFKLNDLVFGSWDYSEAAGNFLEGTLSSHPEIYIVLIEFCHFYLRATSLAVYIIIRPKICLKHAKENGEEVSMA